MYDSNVIYGLPETLVTRVTKLQSGYLLWWDFFRVYIIGSQDRWVPLRYQPHLGGVKDPLISRAELRRARDDREIRGNVPRQPHDTNLHTFRQVYHN